MTKYAFTTNSEQCVEYIGRVVEETPDSLTLNVYAAFPLMMVGAVEESDELKTFSRSDCRIFCKRKSMLEAYSRVMDRYYLRTGTGPYRKHRVSA